MVEVGEFSAVIMIIQNRDERVDGGFGVEGSERDDLDLVRGKLIVWGNMDTVDCQLLF